MWLRLKGKQSKTLFWSKPLVTGSAFEPMGEQDALCFSGLRGTIHHTGLRGLALFGTVLSCQRDNVMPPRNGVPKRKYIKVTTDGAMFFIWKAKRMTKPKAGHCAIYFHPTGRNPRSLGNSKETGGVPRKFFSRQFPASLLRRCLDIDAWTLSSGNTFSSCTTWLASQIIEQLSPHVDHVKCFRRRAHEKIWQTLGPGCQAMSKGQVLNLVFLGWFKRKPKGSTNFASSEPASGSAACGF